MKNKQLREVGITSMIFFIIIVMLGLANNAYSATVYDMQIVEGIIHTSGGFWGGGFGILIIDGTFRSEHTATTVQFSNIDIDPNLSRGFVFPEYQGLYGVVNTYVELLSSAFPDIDWLSFDGAFFSGKEPMHGFADNEFCGAFDGSTLYLTGIYIQPFYDGYQYQYNIQAAATPVPIPGSVILFMIGLVPLGLKRIGLKRC